MALHQGDVVRADQAASVQFTGAPMTFQVENVDQRSAPDGWAWIEGYPLDKQRRPRRRRTILVRPAGLRPITRRPRKGVTSAVGS